MRIPDLAMSVTPPLVLVWLIITFARSKTYREFPIFFGYMLYALLAAGLRALAAGKATRYYWLYWITEAVYGIAEVLVIREVFRRVFALEYANQRWFRFVLPGTVILIFALSLWQTVFHPLGRGISWPVNAIYWFDLGVHLLQGIILVLLLLLTLVFPLQWRQHEFGILTGFGVAATATMFADIARFEWGSRFELFFRYGPPLGYILATLVWLHAFVPPLEPQPRAEMDAEELLGIIRRYRALLEKIKKSIGIKQTDPLQEPRPMCEL